MQPLDFFSDQTMLSLKIALNGTSLRHEAISHNIANVNTPGFKRHDVSFQSQLQAALGSRESHLSLTRTHRAHLRSETREPALEDGLIRSYIESDTQMRNDRNNIDIDREMALLTSNSIRYQMLTRLIAARYNLMQTVVQS